MIDRVADESGAVLKSGYEQLTHSLIMMVDDEPSTMEVVQAFLEEVGYRKFVLVDHSSQAMKVLEETCPDILLLDLVMPEIPGFEILSQIRTHPKFMHLPVIILTSSSDTASKLRALDLGATDFLAKPLDQSELCLRLRNTLAAKAYQDQLAYYDALTNLPNRQLFLERADRSLREAERFNKQMALLTISLDNFERINNTMGLSAGDEVLRTVARRIDSVIRSSDLFGCTTENKDVVMSLFRLEGSSLSLLLERIQGPEGAVHAADRITQVIKEPLQICGSDLYVTASIGIAMYPGDGNSAASLLRMASGAKDYVRGRGGDAFQFSSPAINALYEKRLSLETRLRKALTRDEFVLHYQPKVDVCTGKIYGVEALLRWHSHERGLVLPADFIPLAEEIGLIVPIGEWVVHEACEQLVKWHRAGCRPLSISINLSAKQFQVPHITATIKQIIDRSSAAPDSIILELTESLLMDDIEGKICLMKRFKDMGLRLSIDDFGTGYSSFNYLRQLPVDELKIDRSFIRVLTDNADNRAVVSSIIFLSNKLNLSTVAEGVETQEQLQILRDERCHQYQGFLFSRPLPADKVIELLAGQQTFCSQPGGMPNDSAK